MMDLGNMIAGFYDGFRELGVLKLWWISETWVPGAMMNLGNIDASCYDEFWNFGTSCSDRSR